MIRRIIHLATLPAIGLLLGVIFLLAGCPVRPDQMAACREMCAPGRAVFVNALKCDCGETAPDLGGDQ